ncbi:2-amino-4-hydroxy-6-hydroxymethyldihydropteridine diphosphokinase [Pseudoxanthomonas sp. UTMC 1351]|uniref:2-amino-4-hydroxy-6- hydroxymethyldihydropteridine diphosphokinase n=1 Tax=Pseudoxanthomonas sp. UTMC 1351 TaxID=2695853 RepID=UPI0034CE3FB7
MHTHRYLLLLGTDAADETPLQQARIRLVESGRLLRESKLVHGPSVVPGDHHRYINQALLIEAAQSRDDLSAFLKRVEEDLGRRRDSDNCLIDIDLVAECDTQDRVVWQNPDKLAHALFRDLVAQILPSTKANIM